MKKLLIFIFCYFLSISQTFASQIGRGELSIDDFTVSRFIEYIRGSKGQTPYLFIVSEGPNNWSTYFYCPAGFNSCGDRGGVAEAIKACEAETNSKCGIFARRRNIIWKNGINKATTINSKSPETEIIAKLGELGFLDDTSISENDNSENINLETNTSEQLRDLKQLYDEGLLTEEEFTKAKKKITNEPEENKKKVVKKYELSGERPIALIWEGYSDLIAGTVKFNEADYKGTLNIPLPNNDGKCEGSYSLQEGGKGTWQISCTNNMGAAGTLKWIKDGGVTGSGRDYNDKEVKFTVSKQG